MIKQNMLCFVFISLTLFPSSIVSGEINAIQPEDRLAVNMVFCSNNADTLENCKEKYDYSWSDKLTVLIHAPAWNSDKNKLDRIGNTLDHPISVRTNAGHVDGPCEFVETDSNSGLFKGRIKLSGFRYDANGDGNPDLFGGNECNRKSPLQEAVKVATTQEGGITVDWKATDHTIISKNAKYSWKIGTLEFDKQTYNPKDTVKISLRDADLQVFPFSGDTKLWIRSDTDSAGMMLFVEHDFGDLFPGEFELTDTKSSHQNRLRVSPGDKIYVQYEDRTLPLPYSVNEELAVESIAIVIDSSHENKIAIQNLTITDTSGKVQESVSTGQQVLVTPTLENTKQNHQPFTCIVQVKDSSGRIVDLSWASGQLGMNQKMNHPHLWIPESADTYVIEVYVWETISNPFPLASVKTLIQTVT